MERVTQNMGKAEILNATSFALVFTNKISLQEFQGPDTKDKVWQTLLWFKRIRVQNIYAKWIYNPSPLMEYTHNGVSPLQ